MGKWEAEHIQYGQWHVTKDDMVIAYRADATEAQPFTEDQATRYALALNVVDAGVDLGDAVEKLKLMHTITAQCGTYGVAHTYASWVEDFLRSIANAVEGDKTKEDV